MRIEGTLAVAGVGGGVLLWSEAAHFGGYGFAAAAFLALGGVNIGVKAMRNYNRYLRGAEGEETALTTLKSLPDGYSCVANFVVPGTHQGDADLLVIGPFGVLVVEVKTYTGHYTCHGDAWFRLHDDGVRQPMRSSVSKQLKRNRKAVQHYLVDCDMEAPVHGVVVFPDTLKLDCVHPTIPMVRLSGLLEHVQKLSAPSGGLNTLELEKLFGPSISNAGEAIAPLGAHAPNPTLPGVPS
ncbi:nuclease-related domain-containing protein [Capsulimonas corticalis]|nr:nuclease-related domain-containing protein [Capsulimonas corticalis]